LLAGLEKMGSLISAECLSAIQKGRPLPTLASLIFQGFLEVDLADNLLSWRARSAGYDDARGWSMNWLPGSHCRDRRFWTLWMRTAGSRPMSLRSGEPSRYPPNQDCFYTVPAMRNMKTGASPRRHPSHGQPWVDRFQPLVCSSAADLLFSLSPSKRWSNSSSAFSSLPLKFPAACRRLIVSC